MKMSHRSCQIYNHKITKIEFLYIDLNELGFNLYEYNAPLILSLFRMDFSTFESRGVGAYL